MPKEFSRTERIAEQIQRKLAVLIQKEIKDPRLSAMITVNAVTVTRDLAYAKVYVSVLGEDDPEVIKPILKVLNGAAGFLRSTLAREIKLRTMPQLSFLHDQALSYGNRMSKLINDALASDKALSDDEADEQE